MMIRRLPLRAAAIAGLAALAFSLPALAAGIRWEKSYKAARTLSQKTGKPLLVEFYADWCGPCKKMEQTTFKDKAVGKLLQRFVVVRVDIDKDKTLAQRYQIESIPHALILSPSGKITRESLGYKDPQGFSIFLKQGL